MGSITFSVVSEGTGPFQVVLDDDGDIAFDGREYFPLEQAARCIDCRTPSAAGLCPLLSSCAQVLRFFSGLVSCQEVSVHFSDGSCSVTFPDTAQRAASLILIYSMIYSGCHFFSRFRFLLKYYPCITSPEALIHLIVTTGLVGNWLDTPCGLKNSAVSNIKSFNARVKERLECIYESVRDFPGEDSIRNAFQILHSVNYISGNHASSFIREMGEGLSALRKEGGGQPG